jgi:hypothetical protein
MQVIHPLQLSVTTAASSTDRHLARRDDNDGGLGAEKSLLQAAQKDPEARRLSGNEAYGVFSAACQALRMRNHCSIPGHLRN